MDPALVPVLSTLAGAIVAGSVAVFVARENQQGQRDLERDKALREWRADPFRELIELVFQRAAAYRRYALAKRNYQQAHLEPIDGEFTRDLSHKQITRYMELVELPEIGPYVARAAVDTGSDIAQTLARINAAQDVLNRLLITDEEDLTDATSWERVQNAQVELYNTLASLRHAVEDYVFEPRQRRRALRGWLLTRFFRVGERAQSGLGARASGPQG